jgi:hypothetical protein
MTRSSLFKSLIIAVAIAATPALGHGNTKPRHGGQVAVSGETVVELVRGPKGISVYVSEEDEPIAASSLTGKLIITEGTRKRDALLQSGPINRLDAAGVRVANGAKVTVTLLTKATQSRTTTTFTVK